ncbi:uncharacterized protein LACBIDRAFT_330425 [Laccaria bicolor S238N-H82]|uniref:Predicted protein n=1 Tax=Laccaria bicolor (strain S238N-H82 / ATCC MYA-4686) TaxID=486041 RepID=B0DL95_LACBS|nr:uncharacterized protein LACBIDRAFT_330425 [Laccaria bicolor S238N-H82]EDR04612.1 predicted protein [Laccaria bicolor S238N-H82]|eukprot:XP_001884784.1 predicted protein [Laccaria bicolor S238N-H82]
MAPRTRTTALKPASAPPVEAQPTSSGRPRTLSAKQQQLEVDKTQKQAASKDKAYVQALHCHQAQEAIMGYQSIPVQSPVEADVESEDEDDQPVVHTGQGFTSFTLQPVIKTTETRGPSKNLVRRVTGQPPQSSPSMMDEHTPGPYSPKSMSLYGRPDGTYYTKEKRYPEAENSDDEFGTKSTLYSQPVVYKYPDAHPELEAFPRAESAHVSKQAEQDHQAALTPSVRASKQPTESSGSRRRARVADFDELSKSLLEETISIYRAQIGGVQPYPDRLEDRDTATGAWVESCNARGVRVEFDEDMLKLITARASQVRGQLKTIARPLVEAAYGINPSAPKREIRNLDTKARKGLYRHPVFQAIINKMWFRNKTDDRVIHPEFSEDDTLSKITMALVITVAESCIDEWQTGEHVDVQFTATAYKHKFNAHLKQIIEFEKKTQESKIIPRLLKHILKLAKLGHAFVTRDLVKFHGSHLVLYNHNDMRDSTTTPSPESSSKPRGSFSNLPSSRSRLEPPSGSLATLSSTTAFADVFSRRRR